MKTILALIDLSEAGREVARVAARMARAFEARLWLVHIADPDSDYDGEEPRQDVSRSGLAHEMRRKRRALQLAAIGLRKEGTRVTALLVRGSPVKKALQELKRRDPDCVVIGKRRHWWLHKLFRGSIAQAVARQATCTVLLVPVTAPKSKSRVRR